MVLCVTEKLVATEHPAAHNRAKARGDSVLGTRTTGGIGHPLQACTCDRGILSRRDLDRSVAYVVTEQFHVATELGCPVSQHKIFFHDGA